MTGHDGAKEMGVREAAALRRAERVAYLFDQRFVVPGTSFRFGYDAIIGLLPVVGDTLGLVVGMYLMLEAWRLKLGVWVLARMALNLVVDWLVGLVPLVDVFLDAAYKANVRNARLLAEGIRKKNGV